MLNRPSCPPDDPIDQGTELNWTDTSIIVFADIKDLPYENFKETVFAYMTSDS